MFRTIHDGVRLALTLGFATTIQGCAGLTEKPLNPDTLLQADALYQDGRLSESETLYREVIQKAPRVSLAWFRLGNIYLRTNQLEAAVAAFQQATYHAPKEAAYWQNLSLARRMQARQAVQTGLVYVPNHPELMRLANNGEGLCRAVD